MSRRLLAVVAAAAALGLAVWSRLAPKPLPRDPGLSVLIVSIDTLRADAVGAYEPARADALDRPPRARRVRFAAAHSHNVVTLPSHVNLLTGLYPFEHGVRDNAASVSRRTRRRSRACSSRTAFGLPAS